MITQPNVGSNVVLVTGASAGIGLELVRKLRQKGYRTVATALPRHSAVLRKRD